MEELITVTNELSKNLSQQIKILEESIKDFKAKEDGLKAQLLEEMQKRSITKIENDDIIVSCIGESQRETLNTKALREELPDIYYAYISYTPVKASIRIKVK